MPAPDWLALEPVLGLALESTLELEPVLGLELAPGEPMLVLGFAAGAALPPEVTLDAAEVTGDAAAWTADSTADNADDADLADG